ncbi:hypothetical protein E1B28_003330 [Marasmius oreades]|uniref:Uncharacterized protein n=1 Tax=Marasmius oreades TaxID=181124 RepID=A0A9P7UNB6_9AGAR|nr:uncharacterized protein E1B28_003330 [Marasmius oreades]KAG7085789.1 hypothetical protein E1B28_003330 [Marasmius oreades]
MEFSFHSNIDLVDMEDPAKWPLVHQLSWYSPATCNLATVPEELRVTVETIRKDIKEALNTSLVDSLATFKSSSASPDILRILFALKCVDIVGRVLNGKNGLLTQHSGLLSGSMQGSYIPPPTVKGLKELYTWKVMLQRAFQHLKQLQIDSEAEQIPQLHASHQTEVNVIQTQVDNIAEMLSSVRESHKLLAREQALHNFTSAALFLRFIFLGLDDIPSSQTEFKSVLAKIQFNVNLYTDKVELDKKTTISASNLRQPLYCAIAISPLILLTQQTLTSGRVDRERLLVIWQSLGNYRPPALQAIEDRLWEELIDVVKGLKTSYEALSSFFQFYNEYTFLDEESLKFFAPKQSLQSSAPKTIQTPDTASVLQEKTLQPSALESNKNPPKQFASVPPVASFSSIPSPSHSSSPGVSSPSHPPSSDVSSPPYLPSSGSSPSPGIGSPSHISLPDILPESRPLLPDVTPVDISPESRPLLPNIFPELFPLLPDVSFESGPSLPVPPPESCPLLPGTPPESHPPSRSIPSPIPSLSHPHDAPPSGVSASLQEVDQLMHDFDLPPYGPPPPRVDSPFSSLTICWPDSEEIFGQTF